MRKQDRVHARAAAVLLAAGLAAAAVAEPPPPGGGVGYRVGYFNLSGQSDGENPAGFVESIDASPGYSASLANPRGLSGSWRELPADVEPARWLSLVKVKAGRQCDFFAFLFSDRAGTLAYAGRRPSRIPTDPPKYPLTVPPGTNQIPANAIREPATDFLYRYPAERGRERPLLRIEVVPAVIEGVAEMGAPAAERNMAAATVEAYAWAAAFEAGWRPTAGAAPKTVRLSMTESMSLYVNVRARDAADAPLFERRFIPSESAYNHLMRLFFRMRESARLIEAGPAGASGAEWPEEKAVGPGGPRFTVTDRAVQAVAAAGGDPTWTLATQDVLLADPTDMDGRVLVVEKPGRFRVLDGKSGAVLAARDWSTWVLAARAVKTAGGWSIACVDLKGRLTVLRPDTLATVFQLAFPRPLAAALAYGDNVPAVWTLARPGEEEDLLAGLGAAIQPRRAAWLVRDADGFVYAVAAEREDRP